MHKTSFVILLLLFQFSELSQARCISDKIREIKLVGDEIYIELNQSDMSLLGNVKDPGMLKSIQLLLNIYDQKHNFLKPIDDADTCRYGYNPDKTYVGYEAE